MHTGDDQDGDPLSGRDRAGLLVVEAAPAGGRLVEDQEALLAAAGDAVVLWKGKSTGFSKVSKLETLFLFSM